MTPSKIIFTCSERSFAVTACSSSLDFHLIGAKREVLRPVAVFTVQLAQLNSRVCIGDTRLSEEERMGGQRQKLRSILDPTCQS